MGGEARNVCFGRRTNTYGLTCRIIILIAGRLQPVEWFLAHPIFLAVTDAAT
jgi:hypothetical protein